jgi:2-aminoadipate transaminase
MKTPEVMSTYRFAERTSGLKPSAIRELLKTTVAPDLISFAGGLPAPELFPIEALARAAQEVLSGDGPAALQYGVSEGHLPLREWVCEHLARAEGIAATPDRVLITNGSQQGLDLVAKTLIDPGDVVVVENPAYLGALQAFKSYQARIVGVPGDGDGIRTDELEATLARLPRPPKLLYLIPNFQNPTGTSLSAGRRARVLELAAWHGVPIVEDDPYGRLRFSGPDVPPLAAMPGGESVLYLGTSSKILAPGLRVAWLVAPDREVYERLVAAKQAADLHTSSFAQRVVCRYLGTPGALDQHIGRLRAAYALRRTAMLQSLERHLPRGCTWTRPDGGLFLWVRLPPGTDGFELLRAATLEKVAPGEGGLRPGRAVLGRNPAVQHDPPQLQQRIPREDRGGRAAARRGHEKLRLSEQGEDHSPDVAGDHTVAGSGRVHAVALVQIGPAADALKKERHKRNPLPGRNLREDPGESPRVILAHVREHPHAGQDDPGRGAPRPDPRYDGLQVRADQGWVHAAQAVVRAEREDEDIDRLPKDPIHASQAPGRCLTAEAGVDHAPGQAGGGDLCLDDGRV